MLESLYIFEKCCNFAAKNPVEELYTSMIGSRRVLFLAALFCMVFPLGGKAQEDMERYLLQAGDHAALYCGMAQTRHPASGFETSPYWKDGQFCEGKVCFDGVVYPHVLLRYDLEMQQIEVRTPERKLVVIPDRRKVEWFSVNGEKYVRHGAFYTKEEYEGRSLSFGKLSEKVRISDRIENNMAYKTLKEKDTWYVVLGEDSLQEMSSLRRLRKMFPDYKSQLSNYARKEHLKFRKKQKGGSLASCVQFLDNLLPEQPQQKEDRQEWTVYGDVPDSVWAEMDLPVDVPAYEAFREGANHVVLQEEETKERPKGGIRDLDPLKEDKMLNEMVVTAFRSNVTTTLMGSEKFRPAQLRNLPMALGEGDVMKMVQTLPGVTSVGEASDGFNVRGGATDQNLILLNNNTIFNPMHLFGLFSAFNADAINDAELMKGSLPVQYGGRLSSVMSLTGKQASKQQWHGSASMGLLTSKAQLEVPLVKNKVSLLLAGRTTYSDWLLKKLPEKSEYRDGKANFYDLTGTLAWSVNKKHYLNLYGYFSHDRFSFTPNDRYNYQNGNGSMEWKSYWNEKLSSTISAGYDQYNYKNLDEIIDDNAENASQLKFHLGQKFLRGLFSFEKNEKHTFKWGWNALQYQIEPGKYKPWGEGFSGSWDELEEQKAVEGALFAEDEWKVAEKWTLNGGVRYNLFHASKKGFEKTYQTPEVRLSAKYSLSDNQSLKMSLGNTSQFIHKVSNTLIMSPTDTWTLSNASIKPQRGWQMSGGYYMRTENRIYELSAEIYYKRMANCLTYKNGAQILMNHELEKDLLGAQGKAYGLEVQLKKTSGKLNGWISYCFSRSFLRQHDKNTSFPLNEGNWFSAEYDRPHTLNVVANLKLTQRFSLSLNMDYATGRPTTIPTSVYFDHQRNGYLPLYTKRNSYRLPDNFRTDLSFNVDPSHHLTQKVRFWMTFGAYNLFGRKNVYNVYYENFGSTLKGYKLSIFGVPVPFLSINLSF